MQNIPIANLYPGMIIAEDVYVPGRSQMILSKGLKLTDKIITKLEMYPIISVKVEDPPEMDASQPEASFSERVRNSQTFKEFSHKYDENILVFKDKMSDLVLHNKKIDPDALLADTLNLLRTNYGRVNVFDMLTNLHSYDDLTYSHAINVALISYVFAGWLHFSQEDTEIATLCGLLHDIGKLMVPEEILKKPAALTAQEYEIIKTHTINGYRKLRECGADMRICNAALMHHERYDGSGYPSGLKKEQITSFASLVSLADVYEAMTATRVYRGPICPFKVISLIESEGYQKYAPQYLLTFLENIVNTYILNTVLLSNGVKGTIIHINRHKISCPTLKTDNGYIDLSSRADLSIVKVI